MLCALIYATVFFWAPTDATLVSEATKDDNATGIEDQLQRNGAWPKAYIPRALMRLSSAVSPLRGRQEEAADRACSLPRLSKELGLPGGSCRWSAARLTGLGASDIGVPGVDAESSHAGAPGTSIVCSPVCVAFSACMLFEIKGLQCLLSVFFKERHSIVFPKVWGKRFHSLLADGLLLILSWPEDWRLDKLSMSGN